MYIYIPLSFFGLEPSSFHFSLHRQPIHFAVCSGSIFCISRKNGTYVHIKRYIHMYAFAMHMQHISSSKRIVLQHILLATPFARFNCNLSPFQHFLALILFCFLFLISFCFQLQICLLFYFLLQASISDWVLPQATKTRSRA